MCWCSFQQLIYGKLPDCIDRIKLSVVLGYPPVSFGICNFLKFFSSLAGEDRSFLLVSHKSDVDFITYISISYLSALTNFRGKTSITRTRITRIPRSLELNLLSLDQNFTEIYPYNSDSPLTRTVFRFPL